MKIEISYACSIGMFIYFIYAAISLVGEPRPQDAYTLGGSLTALVGVLCIYALGFFSGRDSMR